MSGDALTGPLATAPSFLFVPATRPERLAKALASGAGGVIVDLEDAVAPDAKDAARSALPAALAALEPAQRARLAVRLNAATTPWHADDLALAPRLCALGVCAFMLSKAEDAGAIETLARRAGPGARVIPLLESNAGLDAVARLAAAPQVLRLAFGHLDFMADLGMQCEGDEPELVPVRLELVRASRRAGLAAPLDGVTAQARDAERAHHDARRARRFGFGGKLCIHPDQVAAVNRAFAPTADELDWARRVVEAAAAQGAVFMLDGRMVDAPVERLARQMLARAAHATPAG